MDSEPPAPASADELPEVFCPFADDGHCPGNPPCPSPRERACTGAGEDE